MDHDEDSHKAVAALVNVGQKILCLCMIFQLKTKMAALLAGDDWLPDWAFGLAPEVRERDVIVAANIEYGSMINTATWNSGNIRKLMTIYPGLCRVLFWLR